MSVANGTRRIRLTIEAESHIVIDEQKLEDYFGAGEGIKKMQKSIEEIITSCDGDRDTVGFTFAVKDGYEKYAYTEVTAEIEEYCAEHQVWFALDPVARARCWMCADEKRGRKKK